MDHHRTQRGLHRAVARRSLLGADLLDRLLAGARPKQRLLRGSVVGWTLFTPTIFWISQLTAPGYVIAVWFFGFLLGLFCLAVPPRAGRTLGLIGLRGLIRDSGMLISSQIGL